MLSNPIDILDGARNQDNVRNRYRRYRRHRHRALAAAAVFFALGTLLVFTTKRFPPPSAVHEICNALATLLLPAAWVTCVVSMLQCLQYRCPACDARFTYAPLRGTVPGNTCRNCHHHPLH